ncbi:multicopper oxidase domain-containing protein [Streptomyces boninensis]|uniref:multicopper oxidase domain-containing protein n=1 Tax=Streptomyces boninensis TaxID=2039455 RepID=UPI003B21A62B
MPERRFSRRTFTTGAAAAVVVPTAALSTGAARRPAADPGGAEVKGVVKNVKMYAEALPNNQLGYGLEPGKATIPGPLLVIDEGDTLVIELNNTLDVPVSIHPHGVDYTIDNDGTAMTDSVVPAGGKRTYTWSSHAQRERSDGTIVAGSAGYWHYHDHIVGTEHGTGGVRRGLYGGLIVRRKGDPLPDKTFTIVFNDMTINNKTGAAGDETPNFTAKLGDRVEILMITHGDLYHTFHLHGHRWADNRTGFLTSADDPTPLTDNKICGPGDSFGFQVVAGELVGSGHWMYHCHVQSHSDQRMAGMLIVQNPDGTVAGKHRPMSTKKSSEKGAPASKDDSADHAGH